MATGGDARATSGRIFFRIFRIRVKSWEFVMHRVFESGSKLPHSKRPSHGAGGFSSAAAMGFYDLFSGNRALSLNA
jgi:hypothetical protein